MKKRYNHSNSTPLYVSEVVDNSSQSNVPVDLSSGQDLNIITDKTSSIDNISSNNTVTASMLNASEESLSNCKPENTENNLMIVTCDNKSESNEVSTCNNATMDVTCDNQIEPNEMSTCNNVTMNESYDNQTDPKKASTCNNATMGVICNNNDTKLANTDVTCSNVDTENGFKEVDKPGNCDEIFPKSNNDDIEHCDVSPLSLEDSPLDVLNAGITTLDHEDHVMKMSVSSNNEEVDSLRYDSDISDCSSRSCISVSSSDDNKIPTLVKVSREVMDEIGNKECWLLIQKLSQLTIDYWKNSKARNQVKSNHNETDTDCTSPANIGNKNAPSVTNTEGGDSNNGVDNHDSENSSTIEDQNVHISSNDMDTVNNSLNIQERSVQPGKRSEHTSSSSENDSLINPIKAKPPRWAHKRVNYSNMCERDSSSDENSDNIKTPQKDKPSTGAAPSLSRLRAQELISKHRVSNHPPDPIHTANSSDLDSNSNNVTDTADYSGDTDEHTVPTNMDIKTEPMVDNIITIKTEIKSESNMAKPSKAKQQPNKNVKDKNSASPVLKLKKGGSKGEWHIKAYA